MSDLMCATDSEIEATLRLQNARLAALNSLSFSLASTLDLRQVLARLVDLAQSLTGSAHAHLYLYDSASRELSLVASRWSDQEPAIALHPRPDGITATVARTGEPAFLPNTVEHDAYRSVPPALRPGALACLPLLKDAQVLGTLNLGFWEPHVFDEDTRLFLNLLAQHAALAIDNAHLHALAVEKAKLDQELATARAVQASLLPHALPELDGWEIAVLWQPAHVVGGDLYDFASLVADDGAPVETFSIADVADKGMPAALFMALTRATLRASVSLRCCPSDCVANVNQMLCQDASDGMFVTLCHAELQSATGELTYVNAGHNPPLWFQSRHGRIAQFEQTGIALGIEQNREFEERTIRLLPEDVLLFYTDGVTDATNETLHEFGKARLKQLLCREHDATAAAIAAALDQALREFVGAAPQFDDITAVVLKRTR